MQVVTEFVALVPARLRDQGIALASARLLAAQYLGMLTAGPPTELLTPSLTIASAGATATSLGVVLAVRRGRHYRRRSLSGPVRA